MRLAAWFGAKSNQPVAFKGFRLLESLELLIKRAGENSFQFLSRYWLKALVIKAAERINLPVFNLRLESLHHAVITKSMPALK